MSAKPNVKDLIVSTAAKLFFSQGYHATGLSQIIKESHTPKGSLYHYFPNGKEELAFECIQQTNKCNLKKFDDTFAGHDNTADALVHFIHDLVEESEANGFTGSIPFSLWAAVETSSLNDQLQAANQAVFTNWQELIVKQLLLEGVREEKARETALFAISLMEGAIIISLTNKDKQPLLTAAKFMSDVIRNVVSDEKNNR